VLLPKIKKIPKNTNGRLAIPALAGLLVLNVVKVATAKCYIHICTGPWQITRHLARNFKGVKHRFIATFLGKVHSPDPNVSPNITSRSRHYLTLDVTERVYEIKVY